MSEIVLTSWKGKSGLTIEEGTDAYAVVEHRKQKETGNVDRVVHHIPKENVRTILQLIRTYCEPGEKYGYRFLVRKVVRHYKIAAQEGVEEAVMLDMFNGGTMRAKHYFPKLYYPLKILESQGHIQYWGRGGITLLQKENLGPYTR